MRRALLIVATAVAVIVAGVIIYTGADDDEPRKAAIGSGGKPDSPPGRQVAADQAPDRSASGAGSTPPRAAQALAALQRRIANHVERNGTGDSFASYTEAGSGRIVLITDASDEVVRNVTDLPDRSQKEEVQRGRIVRGVTTQDNWHRRDDIEPYWGGAGLTAVGRLCSSGYAARKASGAVVSVTAGHCWANGQNVLVESGLRSYGTVSDRRLASVTGHPMDVELLGGRTYAPRVYTGGVTSTSSGPVVAAGSAVAGYTNYCHSGRTTGQHCGHTAQSINAQVCTASGCKSPVISFTGGVMIQGGDSGGTFYAQDSGGGIWIRGNTIASASDGSVGYAQPWTVISSELGLSIVTG